MQEFGRRFDPHFSFVPFQIGEAQIICRPLGTSNKDGCILSDVDGMMRFNIKSSMSIPINVIDSKKCLLVESTEWKNQMDKRLQKYPSTIDLLSPKECEELELEADEDSIFHVEKFKSNLSTSNLFLKIEGLLIESNELDKIRPGYKATLVISNSDGKFSVSIPCHVTPSCLNHVKAQQTILADQLLPGCIVKELELEMFDAYGNHVVGGLEVKLDVEGFEMLDQLGPRHRVDHHGRVDLSSLLKVTAGYGENVSLSVSSGNKVFFKQEFQIKKRELRIASKVPEILTAGSKLENIIFEIVNCEGIVDDIIHDEEKTGLSHMLTIKADWLNLGESVRYTFKHGRCIVPAIPLSKIAGNYSLLAIHSRHSNLSLNVEVHVKPAIPNPKVEHDGKNFSTVIENNKKVKLVKCLVQNIVVDISFNQLEGLCTLCFLEQVDCLISKDHLFKQIIIQIKAWCYYESCILGAHHGLISTYALETLVLYIFHLFNSSLNGPLAVIYKFLDYFSNFDWDNYYISLNGPVWISSLPELMFYVCQDVTTTGGCRYRQAIPVGIGGRLDVYTNFGIRKAFLPQVY
ncbi:structural maintenance of chromosomes flexible hinge domain-containing protein GMI1-like isoform X2 [Humulus lupulus]|uniref:structural maintenance of chromosomes flexible hinge domain-containing protein GMI1-like isoform X2 n=2 Tax=Humulus lupulus TaxID=3486 RepID=UPI002B40E492|nr:structural maintenance of chromosomes flexible hinge domain-containing protein GMI1-like isoform X2 [Humulus lupulus]